MQKLVPEIEKEIKFLNLNDLKNATLLSLYFSKSPYLLNILSYEELEDLYDDDNESDLELSFNIIEKLSVLLDKLSKKIKENKCILDEKDDIKELQIIIIKYLFLILDDTEMEMGFFFRYRQFTNFFRELDFCLKILLLMEFAPFNVSKKNFIDNFKDIILQSIVDECKLNQLNSKGIYFIFLIISKLINYFSKEQMIQILKFVCNYYFTNKAEEDKVIVPLVYEGRKIPQKTTSDAIDQYLEQSLIGLTEMQQEDLKRKYSRFASIAPTMPRLTCLAYAIKQHYERYIKPNGFKAMIAESSRVSAIELHKLLKSLGMKSAVVISPEAKAEGEEPDNNDKDKIANFFKTEIEPLYGQNYEAYEDWARNSFTDGEDIDILIVKDKLLTGFDAPIAQVLYIDKSMKTHNLLQAIARVNRVFPGKKNGRIVDFYGIFENLTSAMDLYTDKESGMNEYDQDDIQKTIYGSEDIKKELYSNHSEVMKFFDGHNTDDTEEIQLLFKDEETRKDFYEKLLNFSNSLDTAISNYNVYEGIGIDEIQKLQKDYVYLQKLRSGIKLRFGETVDFSVYESSIKNLLNQFVSAEADEIVINPLYLSDKETMEKELDKLPSKRAKAEAMVNNISTSLSENREKDPILCMTFRQRLDQTIAEYNRSRNEEAYLAQLQDLEKDYEKGFVGNKYPAIISDDDESKGFYGNLKLELEQIIKINENDEIDNQLGKLAISIKNTFRNSQKPGWQYNTVLINNIKQEIEDNIFDFLDDNGINLPMDKLDKIEEDILMTAKSIF